MKAATRNKLPAKAFLGPDRSFPAQDPKHQRLAISGATRSQRAGNISADQAADIKAQARAKLAKGKASAKPAGSRADRIANKVAAGVAKQNDRY